MTTTEALPMLLSANPSDDELLVYSDALEEAGQVELAALVRQLPDLIAQMETSRASLRAALVEPTCLRLRRTSWSWHQFLARPGHPAPGNAQHGRRGPRWSYPSPLSAGASNSGDHDFDPLHDSRSAPLVEALVRRLGLDYYELQREGSVKGPWHLIDLCRDPKRPVE